jgi:hypothetical protein
VTDVVVAACPTGSPRTSEGSKKQQVRDTKRLLQSFNCAPPRLFDRLGQDMRLKGQTRQSRSEGLIDRASCLFHGGLAIGTAGKSRRE